MTNIDKETQIAIGKFIRHLVEIGELSKKEEEEAKRHPELAYVLLDVFRAELNVKEFGPSRSQILRPADSLHKLSDYNFKYWDNFFSQKSIARAEDQLSAVPDYHVQSVEDLYAFHLVFGSLEKTIKMQYRVCKDELRDAWMPDWLKVESSRLSLHPQAKTYEPGIHLVRLDLTTFWDRKDGRTLAEVLQQATESGKILTQLEPLSALMVNPGLFPMFDGQQLARLILAGTVLPGRDGADTSAVTVNWRSQTNGFNGAEITGVSITESSAFSALPTVLEMHR